LALKNIMAEWERPTREWKAALAQFAILFPECLAAV
jgi:transposase-like protein